jgi:O-antigen ligase
MVQEETTWFSGQGVRPAVVPVQVGSAAAPREAGGRVPEPEAVAWTPTRRELWGIALGMWRERPLLGFGPDSFRRLHGARAGQAHWDTRVYANNLLLEAAATTGAAGLLTLAGALVAAGLRAFRRAAAGGDDAGLAATLLALVAAVAAHGVFDYLLAFTGHYLLLGLIVGAISASSADHPAAGR